MFDFAWSEIGLIAAVALILIGPKDLPVAIRSITDMVKKARRMAGEFQTHVDEMLRDANLGEVRDQISAIRNFDLRGEIERHVDPDRSIRDTFSSNPLDAAAKSEATPVAAETEAAAAVGTDATAAAELTAPDSPMVEPPASGGPQASGALEPEEPAVPAFVPPAFVPARPRDAETDEAPAFIPPAAVLQRQPRHPA